MVEARDQREALQALHQDRPALVLTDLRLPKALGLACYGGERAGSRVAGHRDDCLGSIQAPSLL